MTMGPNQAPRNSGSSLPSRNLSPISTCRSFSSKFGQSGDHAEVVSVFTERRRRCHPSPNLYGTMVNEGASKGIIVTTSSYGTDTYEFAKDKPLELIDGGGLLYLLDQVGVKAKIIMPQE
ncbi:MAG: restriction endonuclease [Caldilinea sp. CFX5]|nr:restriction endonuclease [Caldilinea sp. CFX5]